MKVKTKNISQKNVFFWTPYVMTTKWNTPERNDLVITMGFLWWARIFTLKFKQYEKNNGEG